MKTKVGYAILRAAFSFSGCIGRTAYGLSLIICTLLSILILTSILQTKGNTAFLVLLYIPMGWFALAQGAKRCHEDIPPSDTDSASADQKTETSYSKYNKDYRKNYSKKY